MKNKKLNLTEIKVTSFVTSMETREKLTLKGGVTEGCGQTFDYCNSVPVNDCNVASYNATCPTVPVQNCNFPYTEIVATACLVLTRNCTVVIGV
jgi:hypothetical protein